MTKNTILKGFLPLASATLLLSSCSEDKTIPGDNDGQAIVFRVQNALPSSRAAGTTVGYMDAFVINGVVDKVEAGHKSGLTLFDRTTVSRVIGSGANVFSYSPTVYYPKGATKAEFSAFSPVSSRIAASDFQTNDNCITYSVPSPARGTLTGDVDVAPQEDLLVAYTQKDDLSGAVVLQFRHALSRVSVKAVNLIDQPVRIHALSLHNLYVKGKLDIDGDINEPWITPTQHTDYKTLWDTNGQTKKTLAWQLAESGVMVPVGGSPMQVTADDQALLVLPQTTQNTGNDAKADTGDFYLEVTYTVGKITETIQAAFNDINKLTPANNKGLTFEMGRQYAINVSITATGLSFGLEVNNWDAPADVSAVTLVTFAENKPVEAVGSVSGIHAPNSWFVDGQALPALIPATPPTLSGWVFTGYYDAPVGGKLYYKKDLSTDVAIWDKVGTARMYAQWKDCIEIAGIKWAAANVDAPGTFAANEYAYGMLYQFGRGGVGWSNSGAPTSEPFGNMWSNNNGPNNTNWGVIPFDIDPCPDGWSVPTKAELDKLEAKKTTWVTDYLGSGISGYTFTDDPEVLFLPASGWRLNTDGDARDQNRYGMYWSATTILNLGTAYYLRFTNGVVEVGTYYRRAEGFSVRCVRN